MPLPTYATINSGETHYAIRCELLGAKPEDFEGEEISRERKIELYKIAHRQMEAFVFVIPIPGIH